MLPSNLFLLYCKALPVHCQEIVTFNQKSSPRPGLTFTNGTCTIKVSRKKGLFYNFILQTLGRGQTAAPHHTPREGRIFAASGLVCRRRLPPPSSRGEPLPGLPGRYHRRREVRPAGRAIRVEPWSFLYASSRIFVWDGAFFLLSLRLLQSGKEVFLYDQSGSERQREGI